MTRMSGDEAEKKNYTPANADMTIVHTAEFEATPSPEPPGPPAIAKCGVVGRRGLMGQKPQTAVMKLGYGEWGIGESTR